MTTRPLLGILAILVLLGCSAGEGGSDATAAASVNEADRPVFTLPDLDGAPVRLADFRGKTVIIDFWATWCPPCIFQVPELNKFWAAHKEKGDVMVIGVAVDVEGAEVVRPWVEEQNVEYTILIGDEGVAREFGALGFPTLVIMTPEGDVESLHVGLIEVSELEELVAGARAGA